MRDFFFVKFHWFSLSLYVCGGVLNHWKRYSDCKRIYSFSSKEVNKLLLVLLFLNQLPLKKTLAVVFLTT